MPPQLTVEMSGDEARLFSSLMKVVKAEGQVGEGLDKITTKSKAAEAEQRRFGREAKRVLDQLKTPQEAHNKRVEVLNQLLKKGEVDQKKYNSAVRQSADMMRKATTAQRGVVGPAALGQVKSMVTGYLGISTAIGKITQAFTDLEKERREAAQRSLEGRAGIGELAQLAETPEQMSSLIGAAKRTYGEGGAESLGEAGRFIFALKSAGALESRSLFSRLKARSLVNDPAEMAKSAKTMIATMGEEETSGFRALVSKSFGVSQFSPARAEEILQGAARSGTSASELGMTDEAILAATALMSEAKGSAEEGGTYLAQMMRTLKAKGGFKGRSLEQSLVEVRHLQQGGQAGAEYFAQRGGVERLTEIGLSTEDAQAWQKRAAAGKAGMTPADFKEWFGRAQGQETFEVLSTQMGRFRSAVQAAVTAEQSDAVGRKLDLHDSDITLRAGLIKKQAEAKKFLENEKQGNYNLLADAFQDESDTNRQKLGQGGLRRWMHRTVNDAHRYIEGDQRFLEDYLDNGYGAMSSVRRKQLRGEVSAVEASQSFDAVTVQHFGGRPGSFTPVSGEMQATGAVRSMTQAEREANRIAAAAAGQRVREAVAQRDGTAEEFKTAVRDFRGVVGEMRKLTQDTAAANDNAAKQQAAVTARLSGAAEKLDAVGEGRPMLGSADHDR